jgi:hypothetical protein
VQSIRATAFLDLTTAVAGSADLDGAHDAAAADTVPA